MSEHIDETSNHDTGYDTSYDRDAYGAPMVGPLDPPVRPSGFHPVNVGHLVMGVAFAGMVLGWALLQGGVVADDEIRWLMPIPWLAAGAAGLAATVWGSRRAGEGRA